VDNTVAKKEALAPVRSINGIEYFEVNELYRVYEFPNGRQIQIDNVKFLNISPSGGHRIITNDGRVYYVKPSESWFMEIGPSPFLEERGFVL
jgi:hypothetical protein